MRSIPAVLLEFLSILVLPLILLTGSASPAVDCYFTHVDSLHCSDSATRCDKNILLTQCSGPIGSPSCCTVTGLKVDCCGSPVQNAQGIYRCGEGLCSSGGLRPADLEDQPISVRARILVPTCTGDGFEPLASIQDAQK